SKRVAQVVVGPAPPGRQKKPTRSDTFRVFDRVGLLANGPPAVPGCPSPSLPTASSTSHRDRPPGSLRAPLHQVRYCFGREKQAPFSSQTSIIFLHLGVDGLHHDISTVTGEEVVLFALAAPP